jgi:hypothetical protein
VNEKINNEITIYPNPAESIIQVNSVEEIESIHILTLDGKKIISNLEISTNVADVSELSTGVYLVELVTHNNQRFVQRLEIHN